MEPIFLFAGFLICQGLIYLALFIGIRMDKKKERMKNSIL